MKWQPGGWVHMNPSGHPFDADIDCSVADIAAKFAVAGDFDGDGRAEVVIGVDRPGTEGNDLWAMRSQPIGPAVAVSVVGPAVKVRPTDPHPASPNPPTAQLLAARNEFVAFQIVVQAGPADVTNLDISLTSPLVAPGGTIPGANVTIYREDYYDVRLASDLEGAVGRWPDVLIPRVDPWYSQARSAFPITVPAGENRVAWVDVLVPQGAAPGITRDPSRSRRQTSARAYRSISPSSMRHYRRPPASSPPSPSAGMTSVGHGTAKAASPPPARPRVGV